MCLPSIQKSDLENFLLGTIHTEVEILTWIVKGCIEAPGSEFSMPYKPIKPSWSSENNYIFVLLIGLFFIKRVAHSTVQNMLVCSFSVWSHQMETNILVLSAIGDST